MVFLESYESLHGCWGRLIVPELELGQMYIKMRRAAMLLIDTHALIHRGEHVHPLDWWRLARDQQAVVSPADRPIDRAHRKGSIAHRQHPLSIWIKAGRLLLGRPLVDG